MPQLGESMAEATVVDIKIAPGDEITADQEIFEVDTDKASMEVTTPCTGTVLEVTATVGQSYVVGATLGFLEATEYEIHRAGLTKPSDTKPVAPPEPKEENDNVHFAIDEKEVIDGSEVQESVTPTVDGGLPVPVRSTVYLSPRMRARMEELGLNSADLAGIPGSGAGGRVTVEDFEKFILDLEKNKMTEASPMRIAVADSMRRSWTRPLATVTVPIVMDALLAHRKAQNPKPGITLYAIRALSIAISENTAVAGRLIGSRIVHPRAIDMGFAVEVEDGVLVPIIRDADKKTLAEMQGPYEELVRRGQARKLPKEAIGTGIATVTNVGPFGITDATPIPLPEQNLVLGVMAGRVMPFWDEESQSFLPKLESKFILSFDHRILDGGAAGRLLNRIGALLQEPEKL
ncbi:2-oxo acid dehydrogenase subunit E2 [bacterium]|nr:2-oxo acid dehydrogenase subunit E2 [bacterium]